MRACPFCGSGEVRTISVDDSWTETKNIRVVCDTCDAMGPTTDNQKQAERFWDGILAKSDDAFKRFVGEEAVGGVSGPMSTMNNTPGMGNAQPASSAGLNTDGPSGSGDKWDDSSIGMQTNEGEFGLLKNWLDDWELDNRDTKVHTVEKDNGKKIKGYLYEIPPYDYATKPDEINPYNNKPNKESVEVFLIPLLRKGYFKVVDLEKNTVLANKMRVEFESDFQDLEMMIGGWSGPTVFESNINPYDKIGNMMAKKLGVEPPFKQKDSRTNTIVQNQWEELDEDQPDNTRSIDDYVRRPDEVLNKAKKRKVANESRSTIETLDSYLKASQHVPDHPLTLVKKEMIKEEDLRTGEVTKDQKAKEALEHLGVAYDFKEAKSGKKRVFITQKMKEVIDKLAEGGWEEFGRNPENTIRKYSKGENILTIFAEGNELPRATVTPKSQEETSEKLVIRKVVSGSINPYLKS